MMRTVFAAVIVAVMASGCSVPQKGAVSRAEKAYAKGEFEACLQHLARAESYTEASEITGARLSFQKGLCLEGADRKSEAIEVYKNVARKFPDTDWAAQARARAEE